MRLRTLTLGLCLTVAALAPAGATARAATPPPPRLPCKAPGAVPTAAPFSAGGSCAGLRPGTKIENEWGNGCTGGFVFTTRSSAPDHGVADGTIYLTTAGHCSYPGMLVDDGIDRENRWTNDGPRFFVTNSAGDFVEFGRAVYAVKRATRDMTFIRITPGWAYDAQVCQFGGPNAIDDGVITRIPTLISHYGQGIATAFVTPGRTSAAKNGLDDSEFVYATGAAGPGDSGSPVLDQTGRALGLVADVVVPSDATVAGADFAFVRFSSAALERVRTWGRLSNLHVVTAPRL